MLSVMQPGFINGAASWNAEEEGNIGGNQHEPECHVKKKKKCVCVFNLNKFVEYIFVGHLFV